MNNEIEMQLFALYWRFIYFLLRSCLYLKEELHDQKSMIRFIFSCYTLAASYPSDSMDYLLDPSPPSHLCLVAYFGLFTICLAGANNHGAYPLYFISIVRLRHGI